MFFFCLYGLPTKIKRHIPRVRQHVPERSSSEWLSWSPIADEELKLSREPREILAQLRFEYFSRLNSYLSRFDPDMPNACLACNNYPHNTNHLFAWLLSQIIKLHLPSFPNPQILLDSAPSVRCLLVGYYTAATTTKNNKTFMFLILILYINADVN